MSEEWVELDARAAIRALGVTATIAASRADAAIQALAGLGEELAFVRVEIELSTGLEPGQLGMMVPRTRIFVNRQRATELRGDAYAAIAVYAVTHSASTATAIGLIRKFSQTVKVLTEAEIDVISIIAGVAATTQSPDLPVTRDQIARALNGTAAQGLDDRLARLVRRGVLNRVPSGYTVAP